MTAAQHRILACGIGLLVLTVVFQLPGCATTQTPVVDAAGTAGLPDSAVARLEIPFEIDLLTINGAPPPRPAPFNRASSHYIRLPPGRQEIVARYNSPYDPQYTGNKSVPVLIAFKAGPGQTYRFTYEKDGSGRDVRIWIDDGASTPVPALPAATTGPGPNPLEQLKDTWEKANEADRTAFRAWLQDQ